MLLVLLVFLPLLALYFQRRMQQGQVVDAIQHCCLNHRQTVLQRQLRVLVQSLVDTMRQHPVLNRMKKLVPVFIRNVVRAGVAAAHGRHRAVWSGGGLWSGCGAVHDGLRGFGR